MSSDEVVTLPDQVVVMGYPVVAVHAVEITPIDERPIFQGLEVRRTDDPSRCYLQVGPMRYVMDTAALVNAVMTAFPFEVGNVVDARTGVFAVEASLAEFAVATRGAFHTLMHYAGGRMPTRIRGPLDLVALAADSDAGTIGAAGRALDCVVDVDEAMEGVVIDYAGTGFPASVTLRVAPCGTPAPT